METSLEVLTQGNLCSQGLYTHQVLVLEGLQDVVPWDGLEPKLVLVLKTENI